MKNIVQINYWTIGGFEGEKKIETAIVDYHKMRFEGLELSFDEGYGQEALEAV